MPFAGYENFDACVAANQDRSDPEAYCSVIMRQVETPVKKDNGALQRLTRFLSRIKNGRGDEQVINLDPVEVTLTKDPAVREEFVMAKSEILDEGQLAEIAKSLNIKPGDLTEEQIQKAEVEWKATLLAQVKKCGIGAEDYKKAGLEAPPPAPAPAPAAPGASAPGAPAGPLPPAAPEKSVSNAITMAAKMLMPVMQGLPEEIQKFFQTVGAQAPPPAPAVPGAPAPAGGIMKSDVKLFKSAFPEVYEDIAKSVSEPLTKKVDDLTTTIGDLQKNALEAELLEVAKSISPAPEEAVAALIVLKAQLSPEDFTKHIDAAKTQFEAAKSSDIMTQKAAGKFGDAADPIDEINRKAKKKADEDTSDKPFETKKAEAIVYVMKSEPELAARYTKAMNKNAAAVGVEGE